MKSMRNRLKSYLSRRIFMIFNKLEKFGVFIKGPRNIRINPWSNCDLKCKMCYLPMLNEKEFKEANDRKLGLKDYLALIHQLGPTTREVEICGAGETLSFRGIEEMMAAVKRKHIFGRLITSGTLLNDDICKLLVRLKWDYVRVSLNAASKDTYLNTMGADSYDKVIANIVRLVTIRGNQTKPRITLHFVIQRSNYAEIVKFALLTKNLRADGFSYRWPHPGIGDFDNIEPNKEQAGRIIALLQEALEGVDENNFNYEAISHYQDKQNEIPRQTYLADKYCSFVQNNLEILSDGNVVPCCIMPSMPGMLNIRNHSLSYIWRSREYRNFRSDLLSGKFHKCCYTGCPRVLPLR